jgi:hypothetical protein
MPNLQATTSSPLVLEVPVSTGPNAVLTPIIIAVASDAHPALTANRPALHAASQHSHTWRVSYSSFKTVLSQMHHSHPFPVSPVTAQQKPLPLRSRTQRLIFPFMQATSTKKLPQYPYLRPSNARSEIASRLNTRMRILSATRCDTR